MKSCASCSNQGQSSDMGADAPSETAELLDGPRSSHAVAWLSSLTSIEERASCVLAQLSPPSPPWLWP